jgi:hypothetical protein
MDLENITAVEELQRQLEAANARNSQLEHFVQSQLNGDPTVLNHVAQNFAQGGFQIPNNGVSNTRSVSLSRSKSTMAYPTQVKSAITVIHPNQLLFHLHHLISSCRNVSRLISVREEPFLNSQAPHYP